MLMGRNLAFHELCVFSLATGVIIFASVNGKYNWTWNLLALTVVKPFDCALNLQFIQLFCLLNLQLRHIMQLASISLLLTIIQLIYWLKCCCALIKCEFYLKKLKYNFASILYIETANTLGAVFFNVVQVTCFKERRPCSTYQR